MVNTLFSSLALPSATAPPATAVCRYSPANIVVRTKRFELAVDRLAPLPVLNLGGPQTAKQPFLQLSSDFWCLRLHEVRHPTQNVGPELLNQLLHAALTTAARELPYAGLEVVQRLVGS